jgi:hypothetical protein
MNLKMRRKKDSQVRLLTPPLESPTTTTTGPPRPHPLHAQKIDGQGGAGDGVPWGNKNRVKAVNVHCSGEKNIHMSFD